MLPYVRFQELIANIGYTDLSIEVGLRRSHCGHPARHDLVKASDPAVVVQQKSFKLDYCDRSTLTPREQRLNTLAAGFVSSTAQTILAPAPAPASGAADSGES